MAKKKYPEVLPLHDGDTIGAAKTLIAENVDEPGCICPACEQVIARYRRLLYSTMAAALIVLYRHFQEHPEDEWVHAERRFATAPNGLTSMRGDLGKLEHFGLVNARGDGFYQLTGLGRRFVRRQVRVPSFIMLLRNEVVSVSPERVNIVDALTARWNYNTLMGL